jgi:hypothetical protein
MDKQLFVAARKGDLKSVKNLLNQGANIEYIDDEVSQVNILLFVFRDINQ